MAVPYGTRFPVDFDLVFPQGAYIIGEVMPVTEYQSQRTRSTTGLSVRASTRPPGSRCSA